MKKFLGTILVLTMLVSAFSILVFTTTVGAADAVMSINFEDGSLDGWTNSMGGVASISTEEAHGGSKALLATERPYGWSSPEFNLFSAIKAAGPGLYTLHAWVYTDEDDLSGAQIILRGASVATMPSFMNDNGGNAFIQSDPKSVSQSTWTELTMDIIVTAADVEPDSNTINFCIDGVPANFEFYLDDISITVQEAPTPKPGQPAYQFTMAGNYVTGTEAYVMLENVKSDIIDGTTATLNVKNTGSNTFTLYMSIRNDDATWSHAVDSDDLTLAPGETGTITINNVPSTGKHPVLELKTMNANDSFIIGNFSNWGIEFNVSAGVLAPEEVDGTGIFEAAVTEAPTGGETTADVATLGYAIAAVSGLAALIVGKKRISK